MTKKKKKIVLTSIIAVVLVLVLCFILLIFHANRLTKFLDTSLIRTGASSITRIYYYDFEDRENRIGIPHELEGEELFLQKSEWTSLYDMPQNLIDAFIAVEDQRFFEHSGVDWQRTFRALLNYLFKLENGRFGGSTITQQLVKNLTGDNQTTAKRKFEEIIRALSIEKKLGKNEILELYLNIVYLSENCYGVGVASEVYFNKDVSELSLLECASLASIVKSPSSFNPYTSREKNLERSRLVLKLMLGQGKITEKEYHDALNDTITINPSIENESNTGVYSWYTEAIIDEVSSDLSKKYNISKEAGRKMIMKGGLNIYSLIDPELQKNVEDVYENYMLYMLPQNGKYPESSCVIIDPKTSDILALAGGTGKKTGNIIFNRATSSKRPPGSVIKPLSVYAPGIENNEFTYATVYDDTPIKTINSSPWPKNSPNRYRGLVPISFALEHSINTVAVKALNDVGIKASKRFLDKIGISYDEELDSNASSLALGQLTYGENLLKITNAYSMFSNGGYLSAPKTYLCVKDNYGNTILEKEDKKEQVISWETSSIMTKMLQGVVKDGTAKFLKLDEITEVAGKTGTSSNNEDKWFIGYTPYYLCGIWTGFDMPSPIYASQNPSCTLFDEIMILAHKKLPLDKSFNISPNIESYEVCFDSGKLPSNICNDDIRGQRTYTAYFKPGTGPDERCKLHKSEYIDSQDGLIVDRFLPFWRKRRVSLLNFEREESNIKPLDYDYTIKSRKREE